MLGKVGIKLKNTTDSGKLIEHIEEAKSWLDRAKEHIESNPVQGELILNLAQAEVKCAWELTHHQNVSNNIKKLPSRKKNYYIPAVAASIIVISGIIFSVQLGKSMNPVRNFAKNTPSEKNVIEEKIQEPKELIQEKQPENLGIIAQKENAHLKLSDEKPLIAASKEEQKNQIVNQDLKATKPSSQKATPVEVASKVSSSPKENKPIDIAKNIPDNERMEQQSPNKVKPVSQISIDVEALTKEASESLRQGKN